MDSISGHLECGTDLDSAKFSVYNDSTTRYLSGNNCPGYDWTSQSAPGYAAQSWFQYPIPMEPVNCTVAQDVGLSDPIYGSIGVALSGVQIFGPADENDENALYEEYQTFDTCGGHVKNLADFSIAFWPVLNPPGDYHTHVMMGDTNAIDNAATFNLNFSMCSGVSSWYVETPGEHSPVAGFMLDGFPICGPQGADGDLPTDLDACNGHSSDQPFYHYHFRSDYPYTVQCLWGRTDGESNSNLNNFDSCVPSPVQPSQASLSADYASFGGSGANESWAGEIVAAWVTVIVSGVLFLATTWWVCCSAGLEEADVKAAQGHRDGLWGGLDECEPMLG